MELKIAYNRMWLRHSKGKRWNHIPWCISCQIVRVKFNAKLPWRRSKRLLYLQRKEEKWYCYSYLRWEEILHQNCNIAGRKMNRKQLSHTIAVTGCNLWLFLRKKWWQSENESTTNRLRRDVTTIDLKPHMKEIPCKCSYTWWTEYVCMYVFTKQKNRTSNRKLIDSSLGNTSALMFVFFSVCVKTDMYLSAISKNTLTSYVTRMNELIRQIL